MLHLKQRYGSRLVGMMIHAHVPGCGIGTAQARRICCMFDHFVGRTIRDEGDTRDLLAEATEAVDKVLGRDLAGV